MDDIHFIQRGYEDFPQKITKLGGIIDVVQDDRDIQKFKFKTA